LCAAQLIVDPNVDLAAESRTFEQLK